MKIVKTALFCYYILWAGAHGYASEALLRQEWQVDGLAREGLIHVPAKAKAELTPVIFAFHGHGGSMNNAARTFGFHTLWPEAIVVYLQGLNTPGKLTDKEGQKPGWQSSLGDQKDRDLKFFDAVLAGLNQEYRVDKQQLYAAGHSNGGSFTYLLWETREDQFAAFAPSGCADFSLLRRPGVLPKPVLHIAGETDPLVKFAWQRQMIDGLRKLNQCEDGQPCGKYCTIYNSKVGAPVMTFIHPGTHTFPSEAPPLITMFFKEHPRK